MRTGLRLATMTSLPMTVLLLLATGGTAWAAGGRSVEVKVRGTLVAVHADARFAEQTRYYLKRGEQHTRLRFRTVPSIRSQSQVQIRGRAAGASLEVESASVTAPAPAADTTGVRRLLVILASWDGATVSATTSGAATVLFGPDDRSTDRWYRQASYGQLGWSGDVTPLLGVPDPGSCDLFRIADTARTAAVAAGYDPDAYDHVMVDFPRGRCGADGYGEVGGRTSWIIDGIASIDTASQRYVADHELGHNLGRWHSHALECGSVTISRTCLESSGSKNEYGNLFDVMGNNRPGYNSGAVGTFSAKPLIELGWFAGRSHQVTEPGSYDIAPLELSNPAQPQALVIDTPARKYFVEFRRSLGLDAYLADFPEATDGVQVSMRDDLPGGDNGPLLLDMSPQSTSDDFLDATLKQGQSYSDVGGAVRLTVRSVSADYARVSVEFGDFAAPETIITAGPSGPTPSNGASFEFSSDEEGTRFECRLDGGDWAGCTSPATYTGLYEGSHVFAVRAYDTAGHVDATEATRTFFVDQVAPKVSLTGPTAGATVSGQVTLKASAQDLLTHVTRVKWFLDRVEIAGDGQGEPWERAWNSARVPNGVHKLIAKARDVAGNWGASRSVLITVANP